MSKNISFSAAVTHFGISNPKFITIMGPHRHCLPFTLRLFFLFLFFQASASGQLNKQAAPPNRLFFDHFGLESGFHSREAMDIVTTPNGMVWVSSNDGLARFDSKRFKFFKHMEGDTLSLSNNYCQALATDKRGLIWVQSDDHLDVFNPLTERFSHITLPDGKGGNKLVYPRKFLYDSISDIMWIGTKNGLYYSKNGMLTLQSVSSISSEKLLANATIGAMAFQHSWHIWVTIGHRIIRLNTRTGQTETYELPAKVDGFINDQQNIHFISAYIDKNKALWLGTWTKGLVSFNTQTQQFQQYCFRDYTKEENTIFDIAQTQEPGMEDVLWLTTAGYGLATFNLETKKFERYHSSISNDPYGIVGTTYGLYPDGKKGMWIGSASGLHRYDFNKQIFKTFDLSSVAKGRQLMAVSSLAIQKNTYNLDEKLWFYIPYHGGYVYNIDQQKIKPLPAKIASYINLPNAFIDFFIDAKNVLWISTVNHGLTGYNIQKDSFVFKGANLFSENKKWVWAFYEDRQHRLWLGSNNGLYVLDSARNKIVPVVKVNDALRKSGHSLIIPGITEDGNGNIWFTADGTDDKIACISKLNPLDYQLEFIYDEKMIMAANHNPVELGSIAYNGSNKIFATFNGEGIAWFYSDKVDSISHFLTSNEGLGSNRTNGIAVDKRGNIWCSTSVGFSCYKEAQSIFTNYNYTNFPLEKLHEPAIYLSPQSGIIYVGQTNAIRYFDAAISEGPAEKTELVFTDVRVLNIPFNTSGKILANGDVIKLTHKQDMVSIEFALLSYTNSASNTYSWILEGWDIDWNTSNNNIAEYINLSPGTYTLKVKAANNQGEWTPEPITLTLKIAYPFYQTWWFIGICLVLAMVFIYWLTQIKVRRIKEKFSLRNKIAADLHDEIGSTLTSINILSNVSQQAMKLQPQKAKELLQQISAQSKTMQQSMSDIVWSIRPDNDKIEDLVTRMREYAAQTLEQLNIDIKITADEEITAMVLPMEYRKELLLIYKEAINNISKHAGATQVKVLLQLTNQHINLTITDNGLWKGNNSGTGTRSMQVRAESLGGAFNILTGKKGTQISATIPIP